MNGKTVNAGPGPLTKEEKSNLSIVKVSSDTSPGNGADYLTARIARDRPDILDRMKAGEFRSVRAAGIAAGIVRVPTRDKKIFDLWLACCTQEEIAEECGCERSAVDHVLRETAKLPDGAKPPATHATDFDPPLYNVTEEQKSYLRGKRYMEERKERGGDYGNQHTKRLSANDADSQPSDRATATKLATEYGVSERTSHGFRPTRAGVKPWKRQGPRPPPINPSVSPLHIVAWAGAAL